MDCEYKGRDDVILEYVEGSLTGDEREAFETHYLGCDRCSAQLQMTEKLIGVMQEHGEQVFARFHEAPATVHPVVSTINRVEDKAVNLLGRLEILLHQRRHLAALGAVAVMALLVGTWVFRVFHTDYQKLAVVEAPQWPDEVPPLSEGSDKLVEQAKEQYQKREYDDASSSLAEATDLNPTVADLEYILGVSQFLAGDLDAAIARLNHALKLNPNHQDAHWYLANAYLKKENKDQALRHLAFLVDAESEEYAKRGREIIKAIDPFYFFGRRF
jgi:tetratricopeptide (TPR) repeat protein